MKKKLFNENDEINLKELIQLIKAERKLILTVALAITMVILVFQFGIRGQKFESEAKVLLTIPEKTNTTYGVYNFPSTDIDAYISEINNYFKKKVVISVKNREKYVTITATGRTPESAQQLAKQATEKYVNTLRIRYKRNAVEVFTKKLTDENKMMLENVKYHEQLISAWNALKAGVPVAQAGNSLLKFNIGESDTVSFSEALNQGGQYINAKTLVLKTEIASLKERIKYNNELLKTLDAEEKLIQQKYGKQNEVDILNGNIDIMNPFVSVFQEAQFDKEAKSPGIVVVTFVAMFMGLVIGTLSAIFRIYWANA